jgi:multiple sugar transport system permease protein
MQSRPLILDLPRLALLSLAAFVVLAPYIWMVAVSVKPQDEVFKASLSLIPQKWALVENYGKVLATIPVWTYIVNGLIVCFGILFFQILFAVPAA